MNRRTSRATESELARALVAMVIDSAQAKVAARPENVLSALATSTTEELNQLRQELETKAQAQAKPLEQRIAELQTQIEAIRAEAATQISVIDVLLSARSKPVGLLRSIKQ